MTKTSLVMLTAAFSIALVMVSCGNPPAQTTPTETKTPPSFSVAPGLFTGPALEADLIAVVTVTDKRYEAVTRTSGGTTGNWTHTIFTFTVDKLIRGASSIKEVRFRIDGADGIPGPIPLGPNFLVSTQLLAFLEKGDNDFYTFTPELAWAWYRNPDGSEMPMTIRETGERITLDRALGEIILVLLSNNIPVALPHSEWPPLPTMAVISSH